MIASLRKKYNDNFSEDKYKAFLHELDKQYPGAIEFRLAETPVFVPADFTSKMIAACEHIIDLIKEPRFLTVTNNSIPENDKVPGTYGYPQMLAFDFGICSNEEGKLVPMLVEMQGFPSLYAFQLVYPEILRKHFSIPDNFSHLLGNFTNQSYTALLKKIILGGHKPENVVLLEIRPNQQKTRIDFYFTRDITGIQPVCLSDLTKENNRLFYYLNGKKTPIYRIYNRLIFDELHATTDLGNVVDIRDELDVEWVPHPDWFYRVSKYTLPLISHPYVPETWFLNDIKQPPDHLENYVLKPLFSFAGQGVVIDVTHNDLEKITHPEKWILQKKVNYAEVIPTPAAPAKVEIRIMYLWEDGASRPQPAINLARLSKGKMIGTRYNKDHDWVGGSVAFFER